MFSLSEEIVRLAVREVIVFMSADDPDSRIAEQLETALRGLS